jgi:ATP-dependent 26S proteasome regulatory subunit
VVYRTDHGFQKKPFQVKKKKINIEDNYNDDFPKVSEDIIKKLNNKGKTGLVILHGDPGTGKTTYIRYLAGRLKRDIIFISPDMVSHITSPEFIPFLMDNSNAILIIEDAEPALQKRQGDTRSGAVSNILNMTDGLLSDCLNISIVATFNTKMSEVDEALRRQGRLLREYKFDKLDVHKAQALMDKIGKKAKVTEPMSLAQIYFYGEEISDDSSGLERRSAGFGRN